MTNHFHLDWGDQLVLVCSGLTHSWHRKPQVPGNPSAGGEPESWSPCLKLPPTTGAAADLFHHFMLLHFMCDRSPEALRSWTSHGCAPTHLRSPLKETSHVCTCASWRAKFFPVCHLARTHGIGWAGFIYILTWRMVNLWPRQRRLIEDNTDSMRQHSDFSRPRAWNLAPVQRHLQAV